MTLKKASLLLAAGLCIASGAHAQEPTTRTEPAGSGAGVTVGIDPATGRLRNLTPAEAAELARQRAVDRATSKSARQGGATADSGARTVRKSADGTVSARLPRSKMSELRGTIGPDGKLVLSENGHRHEAPAPAREAME